MKLKSRFFDYYYCMGALASGMLGQIVNTWLMFFYVATLKFSSTSIGYAMAIYAIWNSINDPILGYISDITKSRWGRRIPYIVFGTLPFALSFMMIWMPPLNLLKTDFLRTLYFLLSICLYDTFFTMVILNWTALFPEMYPREKDRNRVSGLRQIFGVVGAIAATVAVEPFYKAYGWSAMAIVFGILGCIIMYLSLLGSRENPAYAEKQSLNLIDSFKSTLINKSFLTFVFANTSFEIVKLLITASIPFYITYVLNVKNGVAILTGIIFIIAILSMPFWIWITNKKGARDSFILGLLLFAAAIVFFYFAKNLIIALIVGVFTGFSLAGLLLMPDVLISQVIDEDEMKTGRRREGAYFGVNALILRLSVAAEALIVAYVLKWSNYNNMMTTQTASTVNGIRMLMSFIPVVFIVLAVIFAKLYPIHGERLKKIKDRDIMVPLC